MRRQPAVPETGALVPAVFAGKITLQASWARLSVTEAGTLVQLHPFCFPHYSMASVTTVDLPMHHVCRMCRSTIRPAPMRAC